MDLFIFLIPFIMFSAAFFNGVVLPVLVTKRNKPWKHLAAPVAYCSMGACFLFSLIILFGVLGADEGFKGYEVTLWSWLYAPDPIGPNFNIELAFRVDQLTSLFLCFVSGIGTLVFIYAQDYMKEHHHGHLELDPGYMRFFSYVSLFAGMMFTLVLGANLPVMFIGWEGVGLCSYLLIGYYYTKPFSERLSCADAGRKAFVMNRIGDLGLVVAMGLIFFGLGTLDFAAISEALISHVRADNGLAISPGWMLGGLAVTGATLALVLGATGKSAQIPLFTWLPDAMAGPTPVSALIHAATMVTAGIYMVARMNVMFFLAPQTMAVLAVVGAATAFVAAVAGCTQRGIKKALAYSTVSQLGYMFLALGVGAMAAGVFHVFTHAFFKGCLFLAAGAVIHAMHHEEDMFKMGGLWKKMPRTGLAYLLATLAIAGIPPLAGFFSKDEILYMVWLRAENPGTYFVLWGLGVATAFLTAFYMGRTFCLTFLGKPRMSKEAYDHVHEVSPFMWGPVMVLAVLAIVVGFLNVPKALNLGFLPDGVFHHFLAPVVDQGAEHVAHLQSGGHGAAGAAGAGEAAAGEHHAPYGPLVLASLTGGTDLLHEEHGYGTEQTLALISVLIGVLGLLLSYVMYGTGVSPLAQRLADRLRPLHKLSYNAWGIDRLYTDVFQQGTMDAATGVWKFDAAVVDGAVNGTGQTATGFGQSLRNVQDGQVQRYGLLMVFGLVLFLVLAGVVQLREVLAARAADASESAPAAQVQPAPDGNEPVALAR